MPPIYQKAPKILSAPIKWGQMYFSKNKKLSSREPQYSVKSRVIYIYIYLSKPFVSKFSYILTNPI